MKRALLAVLILGTSLNPAFGQTKTHPRKSPQISTAPQHDNKPEEKQSKVEKHEVLQPFSLETLSAGRIDPRFTGAPVAAVLESIEAVAKVKKGEFESTAEFETRRNAALSKKIVGNVVINDLFPFVVKVNKNSSYSNGVSYSYDADAAEASLYILPSARKFNGIGGPDYHPTGYDRPEWDTLELGREYEKSRTYEASNAYGATVQVEETRGTTYSFATDRIPYVTVKRERFYDSARPVIRLKMDSSTAAKELPSLKALLIVKLKPPYVVYDFFHVEPTRDNPREMTIQEKALFGDAVKIVFYSGVTGQIFSQFPNVADNGTPAVSAP